MASTDARLLELKFLPGFHRESTQYSEEGKWFDGNRVRFREGKPENIRGYSKFSTDTYNGIPRKLLTWVDNNTRPYQGIEQWHLGLDSLQKTYFSKHYSKIIHPKISN